MEDLQEMRTAFYVKLNDILSKKGNNHQIFTKEKYKELLETVKVALSKTNRKTPREYQIMKSYNVTVLNGEERLTFPTSFYGGVNKLFVYTEEVFDILHETHLKINHGGRTKMTEELQKSYKNITNELTMIYLSLCHICRSKNRNVFINQAKKCVNAMVPQSNKRKKIIGIENISKYQIELIDMTQEVDNNQKYILVYKNLTSDYIQLRTLKSNDFRDIVPALLDLFTIFGVPCILFSSLGSEFLKNLISELYLEWSEIKIILGEGSNNILKERQELTENIKRHLNDWRKSNRTCNWSKGVRFVQLLKNRTNSKNTRTLAHDWTFRTQYSEGLKKIIPENVIDNVNTETELQQFIDFYKEGLVETSNEDEPSNKQQKTNTNDNVDFGVHSLFDDSLLVPVSSVNPFEVDIKNEPLQ